MSKKDKHGFGHVVQHHRQCFKVTKEKLQEKLHWQVGNEVINDNQKKTKEEILLIYQERLKN